MIDNLYHKSEKDVADLDHGRMDLKELEDKFNSHFQVKLDKIEEVSLSKIAADVEQKLLTKLKAVNDAIQYAVTVQIENAVDDFREEIFWLVDKEEEVLERTRKKGRKR